MKYIHFSSILLLFTTMFISCSDDEHVTPEISLEEGSANWFSSTVQVDNHAQQKSVIFTSSVDWTLTENIVLEPCKWCSVTPSSGKAGKSVITFNFTENPTYDDRSVAYTLHYGDSCKTIIITQKKLDALTITSDKFEVPSEGGTIRVEVVSNENYSVEIPDAYKSWISRTDATRGLQSSYVSFNISASEEYDKREGKIIFKLGDIEETIKVYQAGSAIIVLTQNEYTIGSDGGLVTIDLRSNCDIEVDMPSENWLRKSEQTRALSARSLYIQVDPNYTYDDRQAVVVICDKNTGKAESVTINQRQKDAILLSNKKFEIGQNGGSFDVDVNSNVNYSVEISESAQSWITQTTNVKGTRALTTTSCSFNVSTSYEIEPREGEIYFVCGDVKDTLKVYQSGGAQIILSKTEYDVNGDGETILIELKHNMELEVSISEPWIQEVSTRAVSSSTKQFVIASNKTGKDRTGVITFTTIDGSRKANVSISQGPRSNPINIPSECTILIGDEYKLYEGDEKNITWTSSDENVATVDAEGIVTAKSLGTTTITGTTFEGDHTAECKIMVKSIEFYISCWFGGGAIISINDLITYGSQLNWYFANKSSKSVKLISLQLIDGSTSSASNEMYVNQEVNANKTVGYATTIGLAGIHRPVICRFKYEYMGDTYFSSAIY